ncbi:hypothetical protein ABZ678_30810, partial [Streptomyces hirsutus]
YHTPVARQRGGKSWAEHRDLITAIVNRDERLCRSLPAETGHRVPDAGCRMPDAGCRAMVARHPGAVYGSNL